MHADLNYMNFSIIFNLIIYILYVDWSWASIRCTTLRYLHSYIGCSNLFTSSLFRKKKMNMEMSSKNTTSSTVVWPLTIR